MWKKIFALTVVFSLLFGSAAPFMDTADAKPKYRSPSKSYTPGASKDAQQTPQRSENVNNGATTTKPGATTPTTKPSLGGGLMKGLLLGGLAGLMFGGLLSGLGGLGSILGLLINVLAIVVLFVLVRKVIRYFMNKNQPRSDYR